MSRQIEEDTMEMLTWNRWEWAVWQWHHPITLLVVPAVILAAYAVSKLKGH